MRNKRIFSAILAALMLVGSTSCSNSGNSETTETKTSTETEVLPETEAETEAETEITMNSLRSLYSDRDYGGYEFRITDRASGDWATFDVYSEEMNGETINDAVYSRNNLMEELLNIKILENRVDSPSSTARKSITAGSDDVDNVTDGIDSLCALSTSGLILDYRDVSTIHLENEWWDQAMYKKLSVLNHNYVMTGDISIMDNYGTWCYLFNKDLVTDLGLENLYTLVNEGKWTLDKHNEMATAAMRDVDGDGAWTDADIYGYITEDFNAVALWLSMGYNITNKDENDLPYFNYDSEASVTALINVIKTQQADFTNMGSGSTVNTGGGVETINGRERQFAIGGALFYYAGMRNITLFRDSDVTFGIIPAPKENEAQQEYYSCYSCGNLTAYSLPKTISDTERTGDIMEIMAHLSKYSLTPAYVEQTLIGKASRDEESEPMIYLILENRNYDLGAVYDWGGVRNGITTIKDPDKVSSTLASRNKVGKKALDKYISSLDESVE